jgi:hypothetical protein
VIKGASKSVFGTGTFQLKRVISTPNRQDRTSAVKGRARNYRSPYTWSVRCLTGCPAREVSYVYTSFVLSLGLSKAQLSELFAQTLKRLQ